MPHKACTHIYTPFGSAVLISAVTGAPLEAIFFEGIAMIGAPGGSTHVYTHTCTPAGSVGVTGAMAGTAMLAKMLEGVFVGIFDGCGVGAGSVGLSTVPV